MLNICKILFLFTFLFLSFECEKKDEKILNEIENKLLGEWMWIKTVYFNEDTTKIVINKGNPDVQITKIFMPDGIYFNFNKKIKEYGGIYWVDYSKNLFDSTKINYILYCQVDNFIEYSYFSIINDSLILDRKSLDGVIFYYIRKK